VKRKTKIFAPSWLYPVACVRGCRRDWRWKPVVRRECRRWWWWWIYEGATRPILCSGFYFHGTNGARVVYRLLLLTQYALGRIQMFTERTTWPPSDEKPSTPLLSSSRRFLNRSFAYNILSPPSSLSLFGVAVVRSYVVIITRHAVSRAWIVKQKPYRDRTRFVLRRQKSSGVRVVEGYTPLLYRRARCLRVAKIRTSAIRRPLPMSNHRYWRTEVTDYKIGTRSSVHYRNKIPVPGLDWFLY